MGKPERRRHPRISVDLAATIVEGDRALPCTIANFSDRGIFVRTEARIALQRPAKLQFIVKPDHAVCRGSGTVAWKGPLGIGLVLDEVNDAYEAFVSELVIAYKLPDSRKLRLVLDRLLAEPDIEID